MSSVKADNMKEYFEISNRLAISVTNDLSEMHLAKGPRKDHIFPGYADGIDLENAKKICGKLWVPTHLPDMYSLRWISAIPANGIQLIFAKEFPKYQLLVHESPKSANIKMPINKFDYVSINGKLGFIQRGIWRLVNRESNLEWSDTLSNIMYFELDNWIIKLEKRPATALGDDEFIKVAESLREF